MQKINERLPPQLQGLAELFESLPEQERRENLVAEARSVSTWFRKPAEKFLVSDDRKDPDCSDRVAIFLGYDDLTKLTIRVELGPNVQTITKALITILCRALSGETPKTILRLPSDSMQRIVGEKLSRTRSRSINYILNRLKDAARHLVEQPNLEVSKD